VLRISSTGKRDRAGRANVYRELQLYRSCFCLQQSQPGALISRKSKLIETAPGARNMPPALGKDSPGEGGSSNTHAVKNKVTKDKQALAQKHAIGRGISKNDMNNTRTSQVHKAPNTAMKRKGGTERPSPREQMQGDHDVGRGRAPLLGHEQKQHDPHSGGPPRSHHHGGAGGGKRVGSGKFHA
ncbi:unnamed protein product, partial [Scytosiphon promiscuus]